MVRGERNGGKTLYHINVPEVLLEMLSARRRGGSGVRKGVVSRDLLPIELLLPGLFEWARRNLRWRRTTKEMRQNIPINIAAGM